MTKVEEESNGKFRIFSKSGAGFSNSRYVGEILSHAYACLPVFDEIGNIKINEGYEFTIHVRGSIPDDSSLAEVETQVHDAMVQTVHAILDGKLQ